MNARSLNVCAAAGVISLALILVGFVCADFIPPPKASWSSDHLASFYAHHSDLKRFGILVLVFGAMGFAGLVAGMSSALERITGGATLSRLQMVTGAVGTVCLLLFAMLLGVAAFRTDRSPEITQAFHDAGWFMAFLSAPPFAMQALTIAGGVIGDPSPTPLLPRWFAYANAAVGSLLLPGALLLFFKTGPFAYHGFISFWLPLGDFGAWMLLMAWGIRQVAQADAGVASAVA